MKTTAKQKSKPEYARPRTTSAENSNQRPKSPKPHQGAEGKVGSKTEKILELLSREGGASIVELTSATDWLPHTTRAALTGLRKRGHTIEAERKEDGPTVYRLIAPSPAKASRRPSKSKAKA